MIHFFSEEIDFCLSKTDEVVGWVSSVIQEEGAELGDINFIFCNDNYLHKINVDYLNHDTLTDIITFDYCEGKTISSDVFISVERVEENAESFNKEFLEELHRVIIHGVLHLLGYKDKSEAEQKQMREKEDFYLNLLPNYQ